VYRCVISRILHWLLRMRTSTWHATSLVGPAVLAFRDNVSSPPVNTVCSCVDISTTKHSSAPRFLIDFLLFVMGCLLHLVLAVSCFWLHLQHMALCKSVLIDFDCLKISTSASDCLERLVSRAAVTGYPGTFRYYTGPLAPGNTRVAYWWVHGYWVPIESTWQVAGD